MISQILYLVNKKLIKNDDVGKTDAMNLIIEYFNK